MVAVEEEDDEEKEDDEEEEDDEPGAVSAARFCDDMEVAGPTTERCPSNKKTPH